MPHTIRTPFPHSFCLSTLRSSIDSVVKIANFSQVIIKCALMLAAREFERNHSNNEPSVANKLAAIRSVAIASIKEELSQPTPGF